MLYRIVVVLACVLQGCRSNHTVPGAMHFTRMEAGQTGIGFINTITESDSLNVFIDEYMYNGAGVGVGDFNGDGLPDLFFCGSQVSSRLYINKGNFQFEDITQAAGLTTVKWCTGVSIVDINNDGFPDIYVCASHSTNKDQRKNMLFINDGKLHFTDEAEAYGLADTGYSTQAVFLDYDKDGDLDMYLVNHRLYSHTANNLMPKDTSGLSPAEDRLYRNEGVPAGMGHPIFRDVSLSAGIKEDGYGLGVVVTDVNKDGWPDIYVANDYIANDLLWLNNRNGTFTNVIATSLRHQSYNSMGTDAADINNDLLPDLAVVDMLPETNQRKKMMSSVTNQDKFDMQARYGYEPAYVRNMLQLNEGVRNLGGGGGAAVGGGPGGQGGEPGGRGRDQAPGGHGAEPGGGGGEPFFSEIGQLAGVFQTDWSWSILMADLDNDGWKDIHITNGLGKDVTNNDYLTFTSGQGINASSYNFSGGAHVGTAMDKKTIASMRKNLDQYGSVKMESYIFHNNGDLRFTDVSKQAGMDVPAISNGAVYVDLDNDGDLDLVVNNMDQGAFVWRNDLRASGTWANDSTHNFLTVELRGSAGNVGGLGTKVTLYDKGMKQFLEQSPVRGFSSCVDGRLHFGVGDSRQVDSLVVQWPDDAVQVIAGVKANQFIVVKRDAARRMGAGDMSAPATVTSVAATLFTETAGLDFKHTEMPHYDFEERQPLLQKYSQLGPCLATGDVNGDGLMDVFVGGAANQPGRLFIQQVDGSFVASDVGGATGGEDLGSIFFDADGDGDPDLLVTGGSSEFMVPKYNQPRLYLNDGKGHFALDPDALPAITGITKAVTVADYDGDGDLDIFIGGRVDPKNYPHSPRSYILQNDKGKFKDVTTMVCAGLEFPGMITDALFTDFDNDKKPDLMICGEWMGVRIFKNVHNHLIEINDCAPGLWRCIQQADIDGDGDMDYLVGNMGQNNKYGATAAHPMMLYTKDMDKNGLEEIIPAYYIKDRTGNYQLYPGLDRNQLAAQMPAVKKKYLLHKDYSSVTMAQLKNDFGADGWTELKCETSATVWIENLGNGKFKTHPLPVEAQFAPVNSIVATDLNHDGHIDLVLAGNEYQSESNGGRYDASYGLVLLGNGKGDFRPLEPTKSGLIIDGDVRDMKMIETQHKGRLLLAAPNDSKLKTFQLHEPH